MNIFKVYAQLSVSKYDNQLSQTKFTVVREAIKQFMDPNFSLDVYETQFNKKIQQIYSIFGQKFITTVMRQVHTTLKKYH